MFSSLPFVSRSMYRDSDFAPKESFMLACNAIMPLC